MQSMLKTLSVTLVISLTVIPSAFAVGSSGFENASLSTRSLAKSNAVVADPEGADTVAFNPAGLTKLEGSEVYFGTNIITVAYDYEAEEGRQDESNSETLLPLPFFYLATPTPIDGLVLGAGMNSPFGLVSKWSSTGNFRYTGYYNELKTAAYTLSLGYEIAPWLSIGGGWTYMDVAISQVGKFNTSFLVGAPAGTFADSPFELDVEGVGQGWNLGVLLTPNEQHSIGVFFRSQIQAELKGILSSDQLGPLTATFGGGTSTTSADTDYSLPANVTLGWKYVLNDKFDFEADLGWTGWSSFDQTEILYGTSNAILAGFDHFSRDYNDVFSVNTGVSYEVCSALNLMGGYFYYQMAANKDNFDNSIPDGDRHGASIGLEWKQGNLTFDIVYLAEAVTEVKIDNTSGIGNGADISGKYSGVVQLLTTGVRYSF